METKKKVLYIYGYGGSPMSSTVGKLQQFLPCDKYEVMCFDYPQRDCAAALAFLEEKIKEHNIEVVMGSSLGAFLALCLNVDSKKIIVNPCLVPTVELAKLKPLPGKPVPTPELIASYGPFESRVFDHLPAGSHCFMAEHDELLGNTYRPCMEAHLPTSTIPGTHRLSSDAMPLIVKCIAGDLQ